MGDVLLTPNDVAVSNIESRFALADEIVQKLEIDIAKLTAEPNRDIVDGVSEIALASLAKSSDVIVHESIVGILAAHSDPDVRSGCIDAIEALLPLDFAYDALFSLSTDPDDIVCLRAMQCMGDNRVDNGLSYLLSIIGSPSKHFSASQSPVGRGASYVFDAVQKILGADTPRSIEMAERDFHEHGSTPTRHDWIPLGRDPLTSPKLPPIPEGMIVIPAGYSNHGLSEDLVPDKTFDWVRSAPSARIWQPDFYIDRDPVSNEQYDIFADAAHEYDHAWCHPLEVEGKLHARNTLRDPRVGPDHPVTGVDWFDAWSYARWSGKMLPTEFQWEKAARGIEGSTWSWGDDWDPSMCNWFGNAFNTDLISLADWRRRLAETSRKVPQGTTIPIGSHVENVSSYGMRDASGNCWEWTRSDLDSTGYYSPSRASRAKGRPSVVLKGGGWSSLPGQLFPSFRGQDEIFCRHNEIGFRCVVQPSSTEFRKWANGPVLNTAVY